MQLFTLKCKRFHIGLLKNCFSMKNFFGIFTSELFRSIDEKTQKQSFSAVYVEINLWPH